MRELKFRVWLKNGNHSGFMYSVCSINIARQRADLQAKSFFLSADFKDIELMQYTGLLDKNGDNEVYECDIIDTEGNVIGNQYETPALLKDETNLLIQGFGTGAWLTTYSQAVERGCHDA